MTKTLGIHATTALLTGCCGSATLARWGDIHMMYVLGWLLIVGSIAVWFLNLGLGALPISGTLFALGVMLAALGAVVQAVKELEKTLSSEAEKGREAYKIGTESLWKQLDAVRASVVAT